MTRRKRKDQNIGARILSMMKRAGRTKFVKPWSPGEIQIRLTGRLEDIQNALKALERVGEIRVSRGLPVVYWLEP